MTFRLLIVLNIVNHFMMFGVNAGRILCVFPTPSVSHHIVYNTLTQELVKRGHEVVVITPHPAFPPGEAPTNLTELDMYDAINHIWRGEMSKVYFRGAYDKYDITRRYLKMFTKIFETLLQSKSVQDLIKKNTTKFDLLMLETNILSAIGFVHIFDVPVIQTSTFGPMPDTYAKHGAPTHPLVYPTVLNQEKIFNLTTRESIYNIYTAFRCKQLLYNHQPKDDEMLRRNFGSDILPISKLNERVNLFFQSVYPIWMNNPPVPPGIVYLGGLHQKSAKKLPQELQTFLDSSENGVIYVSFGTNVNLSHLSQEKINMMARVFAKLPYAVLWKIDKNVQFHIANNIRTSTWFPQSDLLYHPKIKLFITQGGLQSTEESIFAGVPLIGIPMMGDQWLQTENYVRLRIGLHLDWDTLSEEIISSSIARVVEDKSYKENVVRLRNIMNDQPQSALDRAVWWIEYVLRHGGAAHLLPASVNISWVQYYEIELVFIVVFVPICIFSVSTLILLRLLRYMCYRTTKKTTHSKIV